MRRSHRVANPGPLRLAAFALTTFVLACSTRTWWRTGGEPVVFGLALAYGGIAQLLAGMWEFRTGNTFGAVAFTSSARSGCRFWAFERSSRRTSRRPTPATRSACT